MEPDTGSRSRWSTATVSDLNPPIATSSRLDGSAAAGSGPMRTSVTGNNERTATSDASTLLHEIEAKSSRKRAAHVESNPSKTVEVTSRPSFGTDIESVPQTSTTTRSGQSSIIVISHPKTSINTESGQSSIIAAESNPRTTTTGSDQSSAILSVSTTRRSTTRGPGPSSVIRTESTQRGENFTEPDSRQSTVVTANPKRLRVVRPTKKESIAVGTDISWAPAGGSPPRRSTRRSIAAGTSVESPPRRSTESSESDWETFVQYIDTSSMEDWSRGAAATGARRRGSTEDESSPQRATHAGPRPRGSSEHESPPQRASYAGPRPRGSTEHESPPQRASYAGPRPRGSTEHESSPQRATHAGPRPRVSTVDESSPQRASYAGPRPRGSTEVESSPQRASYAGPRPRGPTEAESSPQRARYAGSLPTYATSTPSRRPDTTFVQRRATDSRSTQTGAPGPRGPSVTGFSPNNTPARVTENTPRRSSATTSTAGDTGRLSRPLVPTSDVDSPVQSDVPQEESVKQKNEWALRDLSVYQLTVKSLVVAVVTGVQFSSGSNGEGGIYCSNNEVCIWNHKPKGTIGVDFQLDIRNFLAAVLSSVFMFIGLSRITGERSFWFLMPWLLLVTLSLQKFHIAAVLNLLAFLTTCSHITAVVLMFLCLVLVYLEMNIFYEVFLCTWNLHEDPSLK